MKKGLNYTIALLFLGALKVWGWVEGLFERKGPPVKVPKEDRD